MSEHQTQTKTIAMTTILMMREISVYPLIIWKTMQMRTINNINSIRVNPIHGWKIAPMSMSLITHTCKCTEKHRITMEYQEIMHQRTSIAVYAVEGILRNCVCTDLQGQVIRSFSNLKELELDLTTIHIMKNLHMVVMAPMGVAVVLEAFHTSKGSRQTLEWEELVVQAKIYARSLLNNLLRERQKVDPQARTFQTLMPLM